MQLPETHLVHFLAHDRLAYEEQTAREYLQRARINVFDPVLAELPSIRQAHNGGKAASEVSFPVIRERAIALAVGVATKLKEFSEESAAPVAAPKGEAA